MTVNSEISKITHTGNGATASFPFPFKVLDAQHLRVVVTDEQGVESVIDPQNYSVSGVEEESGSITIAPLASGNQLTILRDTPFTQTYAVTNQSSLRPEQLERQLDLTTMQLQQLDEKIARSVSAPVAGTGEPILFPSPVAGKFLRWSDDGSRIINADAATSTGGGSGSITLPISMANVDGLVSALSAKANQVDVSALSASVSTKVDANYVSGVLGGKADLSSISALQNTISSLEVNDLSNTTITNPLAGQALVYNGSNWVNQNTSGGGGVTSYANLSEVTPYIATRGFSAGTPDEQAEICEFSLSPGKTLLFQQADTTGHAFSNTMHVKRNANYDNNGNSSPGWVNAAGYFKTDVSANSRTNEWALVGVCHSYAPSGGGLGEGGENVGVYAQGHQYNAGSIWGFAGDAKDFSPAGTTPTTVWGAEVGVFANKIHTNNNLLGQLIVGGKANKDPNHFNGALIDRPKFYAGLLIESVNNDNSEATWTNGIAIGDSQSRVASGNTEHILVDNGINIYTDGLTGVWDRGTKDVGLFLNGSYISGHAIRMPALSVISFDGSTGSASIGWNGTRISLSRAAEIGGGLRLTGTTNVGIDMTSMNNSGGHALLHSSYEMQNDGVINYRGNQTGNRLYFKINGSTFYVTGTSG